jgi:hypothetical protein
MANLKLNSVTLATESSGTVSLASGTDLSNSGIVYPTGHIIQMNYTRNIAMDVTRTGDKSTPTGTGITCVLANDLQASSKLFAQFTTQIGEQDGSHWAIQTFITLFNNSVDLAIATSNVNSDNNGAGLGSASHNHGATQGQYQSQNVSGQILFTPTGSGADRRTVELGWGSTSTTAFTSWLNRADHTADSYRTGGTTIILMEVAQ